MLIVHGERDQKIPPYHADRLDEVARARQRREATVETVKLADVDHVMVLREGGASPSYDGMADLAIAREVTDTLVDWLNRVLPAGS